MHAGRQGGCDTSRRKWYKAWLLTSHAKKIRSLVSEMLRKRVTQDRTAKISNRTTCRILYEFKGRRDSTLTRGGSGKVCDDPGRTLGKSQNLLSIPLTLLEEKNTISFLTGMLWAFGEHAYLSVTRWKVPCQLNLNPYYNVLLWKQRCQTVMDKGLKVEILCFKIKSLHAK